MKVKPECRHSSSSSKDSSRTLINCSSDLKKDDELVRTSDISSCLNSSKMTNNSRRSRRYMSTMILPLLLILIVSTTLRDAHALRINSRGGYEDLVVSVGNDVPPITCQQLVQNLQSIFTSSSEYLNQATKGRVYFQQVSIVLPSSWDERACGKKLLPAIPTSASSVRDAQFRIGLEHPVFGHNPWTQQSKGCGKQGDMISAGYQYILQYNDTDHQQGHRGTAEQAFVHEWTKFRYGVFEEIGFENDPVYPSGYHVPPKNGKGTTKVTSTQLRPTSCTNRPLQGNWSGGCNERTGANCSFIPFLNDNDNITSSLMSHPHLPHVRTFCDSTNHIREAPTKHNFLCDQKSVSEVVYSHPDFHAINMSAFSRRERGMTPEFVLKQIVKPRFVLMIEETGNMNLRDVWKYLKLAIRKFIKYDLPRDTQIGLMTVSSDIRILANMTTLDDNMRGIIAEKLPNYPNIESGSGTLSLRKGISQAINMLKVGGQRAGGSVIVLITQGTISSTDLEAAVHLLRQEEVSITTIEYPSIGDGKISMLSQSTRSPHFAIRETGVGTMSHMSTYIQLVNSMMEIQRFFTKGVSPKWPTLIHQEEFKGDAPTFVESQFSFDPSPSPAEFYIYIPNPIDPKVNKVELTSPQGVKYTDQLSVLHDINVIKIDARIDQPGIWHYRIERLGDSHQSHFVQVVTSTGLQNANEEITVRVYSNAEEEESRGVNLSHKPLILYAEVKKALSPVLQAEVEAFIVAGTVKWSVKLFDSGNGDPDLTKGDGIYSRYIIPPPSMQSSVLDITVKVRTSSLRTTYAVASGSPGTMASSPGSNSLWHRRPETTPNSQPCCGSRFIPFSNSESTSLLSLSNNERVASYSIKVTNSRSSDAIPPSRIGDLHIGNLQDLVLTLTLTAPGDDYDHKSVSKYHVMYRRTFDSKPALKEQIPSEDIPAGTEVNLTLTLPSYGLFYLHVQAVDPYGNTGKPSNIVQVKAVSSPPESGVTGSVESQVDNPSGKKNSEGKLTSAEIVYIIVGVIGFFVLLAIIIVVCVCVRRRASKGMGSTETKISTISDTSKAPIHWSASQLLSEHEKRQSMYAPSSHSAASQSQQGSYPPSHHGGGGGNHGESNNKHANNMIGHYNGSPGSSTRSFRSISDNARKTSVDYESCSSDPTVRSAKGGGPTDYETPIESDQENYRTIDSYSGVPPYRLSNGGGYHQHSNFNYNNIPRSGSGMGPPPLSGNLSGSHMQYNPNIQGSLTSVSSKARRNITMV